MNPNSQRNLDNERDGWQNKRRQVNNQLSFCEWNVKLVSFISNTRVKRERFTIRKQNY